MKRIYKNPFGKSSFYFALVLIVLIFQVEMSVAKASLYGYLSIHPNEAISVDSIIPLLELSGTSPDSAVYGAQDIISSQILKAESKIEYRASNMIKLIDGFNSAGADLFYAFITDSLPECIVEDSTLFDDPIVISLDTLGSTSATVDDALASATGLNLISHTDGESIKLRWIVSSYNDWVKGMLRGYLVRRYTSHRDGVSLPLSDRFPTHVVLKAKMYPLSEENWDSKYGGSNNCAEVAKSTIYAPDEHVQSGQTTLNDAYIKEESREFRFLFAMLAAEQDFDVAIDLALGYEDITALPNERYMYIVSYASPYDGQSAHDVRGLADIIIPPAPAITHYGVEDKEAYIYWDISELSETYSFYDIERSTDNANFEACNAQPYVYATSTDLANDEAIYRDSLDDNTTIYYYRICGRNAFGEKGPYSDVINLQGVPGHMSDFFVEIDDYTVSDVGGVQMATLSWESLSGDWDDDLLGFTVETSKESASLFMPPEGVARNTPDLPVGARTYSVPVEDYCYARIVAYDINGHKYTSPTTMVQPADNTPPDPPLGLAGRFITSNRADITWAANTESDFKGYRVFMANNRYSNYVQLTSLAITDTSYTYTIDPTVMKDSVFFKILAVDHRENLSEFSSLLGLPRPDKAPPSAPVLHKAVAVPEGIQLGWKFSQSEDIIEHYIERKPKDAPEWENILTITSEQEVEYHVNLSPDDITATCYVDDASLEGRDYEYRMVAVDDAGNISNSRIRVVRPHDSGVRGDITELRVNAICEPLDVADLPFRPAFDSLEVVLRHFEDEGTILYEPLLTLVVYDVITLAQYNDLYNQSAQEVYDFLVDRKVEYWRQYIRAEARFTWSYDEPSRLKDFQLYKSAEGSNIYLYKTLPIEDLEGYTFIDTEVKSGGRYFYYLVARHSDGGFSMRSNTVMVKVPEI